MAVVEIFTGEPCILQQTTEDEDKWTLKLSAAHGRNDEDGTPKVDWRMTYGSYDARKKVQRSS